MYEAELLESIIIRIFRESKNSYGTREIKVCLESLGYQVSRKKISKIMKENGLVSNYTKAQYKSYSKGCNESQAVNLVAQEFNNRDKLEVVVSDLTYVKVGGVWCYICILLDLFNRKVIGYSVGPKKDAALIKKAFLRCIYPLNNIKIFHSDRGKEYDNEEINKILKAFYIKRSLSKKGNPYDTAVSEAMIKILKTELLRQNKYENLRTLELQLAKYIFWYNNIRIHGSLGYVSSAEY